jgi:hypothetical protein
LRDEQRIAIALLRIDTLIDRAVKHRNKYFEMYKKSKYSWKLTENRFNKYKQKMVDLKEKKSFLRGMEFGLNWVLKED